MKDGLSFVDHHVVITAAGGEHLCDATVGCFHPCHRGAERLYGGNKDTGDIFECVCTESLVQTVRFIF